MALNPGENAFPFANAVAKRVKQGKMANILKSTVVDHAIAHCEDPYSPEKLAAIVQITNTTVGVTLTDESNRLSLAIQTYLTSALKAPTGQDTTAYQSLDVVADVCKSASLQPLALACEYTSLKLHLEQSIAVCTELGASVPS